MAQSKLIRVNQKIAEHITSSFQKMSDTVVKGYTKIEDHFVEQYLTQENETVKDAKIWLKSEHLKHKKEA